jgi:hypothetical protein
MEGVASCLSLPVSFKVSMTVSGRGSREVINVLHDPARWLGNGFWWFDLLNLTRNRDPELNGVARRILIGFLKMNLRQRANRRQTLVLSVMAMTMQYHAQLVPFSHSASKSPDS